VSSGFEGLSVEGFFGSFGFLLMGSFLWALLFVPVYVGVPYALFYKIYYLS
jgi:hypothetical protein